MEPDSEQPSEGTNLDASSPKLSGPNASLNPALTTSTVTISVSANDPYGIASASVYHRASNNNYTFEEK